MSRLTDLIAQLKTQNSVLGEELAEEIKVLSSRRTFGLNFERHVPESVELSGRAIQVGDKVRILPERGTTKKADQRLWKVNATENKKSKVVCIDTGKEENVAKEDLIVVAEFQEYIYPGLTSTGKVENGDDKPFHSVINGENYHALQALTWTHCGKIDAIYIDPPYNTGAKDWKYNNNYVDDKDSYRHSKWLAFMERRLKVAKKLLNPDNSVLICAIDEKEYLRLGLLLEQIFPEANIQMISTVINPAGVARKKSFFRTDEYLFFVMIGKAEPKELPIGPEWKAAKNAIIQTELHWRPARRGGANKLRSDSPNQFYPIFIQNTEEGPVFHSVGDTYIGGGWKNLEPPAGCVAVWPILPKEEGNWQNGADTFRELIEQGYAKIGNWKGNKTSIQYLAEGERKKVEDGSFEIVGKNHDGSIIATINPNYVPTFVPGSQWRIPSHNATQGGTNLLDEILPGRNFDYPKSLYAVEDALRFFVSDKLNAVILDFFAGSGTTAHAVMQLNKRDDGRRQCISITNNEVSVKEQKRLRKNGLRKNGLRPGDPDWEKLGICEHITKPRIKATITGKTPDGNPIVGNYKYEYENREFPMADGFKENAEFFNLTYESHVDVSYDLAFERIAPLLWMRAGSEGSQINVLPDCGWAVADTYGLLVDFDKSAEFLKAAKNIRIAYIVTNESQRFQAVASKLPSDVEPIQLYKSYLSNFRFAMGG